MKSKQELDNKVAQLRECFELDKFESDLMSLQKFFKDKFNKDIIKVDGKATFDFNALFNYSRKLANLFKNDPIQPVTITYLRLDLIFYTYDKHPEMGEQYIMFDAEWAKWFYLSEIKMSELWKNKEYLALKDPEEYYLQLNSFDINHPLVNYIKDIEFNF